MTLENQIKDVISKKLTDGTVEKLIESRIEEGIDSALKELFGWRGEVAKVLESKLKEVMIPQIENHDFSEYLVKLDAVLTELANTTTKPNKTILDNFKMAMSEQPKEIKVSELFKKWKEHVAEEIETDGLEVDYDDSPSYESVEVTLEFEKEDARSWSIIQYGKLIFECDHDEKLNTEVLLTYWDYKKEWELTVPPKINISSLRHTNSFEMLIHSLYQSGAKIIIDIEDDTDYVTPNEEPECD